MEEEAVAVRWAEVALEEEEAVEAEDVVEGRFWVYLHWISIIPCRIIAPLSWILYIDKGLTSSSLDLLITNFDTLSAH